jgi:hypothetical protein
LKDAYGHFVAAAGVFEQLLDLVGGLGQPLPSDLTSDGLQFAKALVTAQAQHCFFLKAVTPPSSSNALLAKLGQGAADAYSLACGLVDKKDMAVSVDKTWKPQLQCWTQYFIAEAQYRLSIDCQAATEIGQELARLNAALAASAEANNHARYAPSALKEALDQTTQQVGIAHRQATQDNATIYLMPVPKDLAAPEGKLMVKAKPWAELLPPGEVDGDLMFQSLIPLAVHQSASLYSERVDQVVNGELDRLASRTDDTKAQLVSLKLPAALDALEKQDGLPTKLVSKVNELVAQGGLAKLEELKAELRTLQDDSATMLRDCRAKIMEEADNDLAMRSHYGMRWTRAGSAELTQQMSVELAKYEEKLAKAKASDAILDGKLTEHRAAIEELSQGVGPLTVQLPGSQAAELSLEAVAAAAELRGLLGQLEQLLTAREGIRDAMRGRKAAEDNAVLTALLAGEGAAEEVFEQHLKKYEPHVAGVAANVAQQAALMAKVGEANARFLAARPETEGAEEVRAFYLSRLDRAADAYADLAYNVREGAAFYGSVHEVLQQCEERVTSFVFARAAEKADQVRANTPPLL